VPHDRSPCPSVAGLTRALGFARPEDFARASSRSASSLVPPKTGRSARTQAVGDRSPNFSFLFQKGSLDSPNFNSVEIDKYWDRSRRTAGGGGEVFRPPCPCLPAGRRSASRASLGTRLLSPCLTSRSCGGTPIDSIPIFFES